MYVNPGKGCVALLPILQSSWANYSLEEAMRYTFRPQDAICFRLRRPSFLPTSDNALKVFTKLLDLILTSPVPFGKREK